jgi:hypothetical protein
VGWRGLLDARDLAQQTVLLPAQGERKLVEKLLRDAPLELVHVHRPLARLDLAVPSLQLLDSLRAAGLLGPVGGQHSVPEPFQDRGRDDSSCRMRAKAPVKISWGACGSGHFPRLPVQDGRYTGPS